MYRADDELNSAILYARCCFNTSTCYTFHSEESKCVCFQVISSHLESCVWHLSHIRHGIVPLSLNLPIQQHSSYSSLPSSATSWATCELSPNPTSTRVFLCWLRTCVQQHFPTHTGQPHVFQPPRVWVRIDTLQSAGYRTHVSCIFILTDEVALSEGMSSASALSEGRVLQFSPPATFQSMECHVITSICRMHSTNKNKDYCHFMRCEKTNKSIEALGSWNK